MALPVPEIKGLLMGVVMSAKDTVLKIRGSKVKMVKAKGLMLAEEFAMAAPGVP